MTAPKLQFTQAQLDARSRAEAAIEANRRDPRPFAPLAPYAKAHGTTVPTIRHYFPGAVRMGPSRRLIANPGDRGARIRPLVVDGDVDFVVIRGSENARRADQTWRLQHRFGKYRRAADEAALAAVRTPSVPGRQVDIDPDLILRLADAGRFSEIDLAETYRGLFG